MVKLISLNVGGISDRRKRRATFKYIRERADIALLQETHSTANKEFQWLSEWGGPIIFNHGKSSLTQKVYAF